MALLSQQHGSILFLAPQLLVLLRSWIKLKLLSKRGIISILETSNLRSSPLSSRLIRFSFPLPALTIVCKNFGSSSLVLAGCKDFGSLVCWMKCFVTKIKNKRIYKLMFLDESLPSRKWCPSLLADDAGKVICLLEFLFLCFIF